MIKSNADKNLSFYINPTRLNYILNLYRISKDEFVSLLNKDRKRDILSIEKLNNILEKKEKINVSLLKRIDAIFNKGVTWYISKRDLSERSNSSIFFRKDSFNSQLNFESKKRIANYEELKFEIQILCKQINFEPKRHFKQYKISDQPELVGREIRDHFEKVQAKLIDEKIIKKPKKGNDRDYLLNMIRIIEQFNIFVFEFVDNNRKPEKLMSFNGFFMLPDIIVIKRQQKFLRREIFTLLHEFAHYLLNFEEIDEEVEIVDSTSGKYKVEQWCNTFAYSFLIRGYEDYFSSLKSASPENYFYKEKIRALHDKTYLSEFALYTRLRIENKISYQDYDKIKSMIIQNIKDKEYEEREKNKQKRLLAEESGKDCFVSGPKAIKSNLFEEVVKINYFEGKIDEITLRDHLKINSKKSTEEVIYS